jgi:Jacalin-like lectin domain
MPLFYCGPSGGIGGDPVDFRTQLPVAQPGPPAVSALEDVFVRRIDVWYSSFIELIWFNYQSLSDPNKTFDATMGGWGGENKEFFHLERTEIITAIRGMYGLFVDSMVIETMNIYTGKKKGHGPFGGPGGSVPYRYRAPQPPSPAQGAPQPDTAIIGLWGGAGLFVDSIGVLLRRPYP